MPEMPVRGGSVQMRDGDGHAVGCLFLSYYFPFVCMYCPYTIYLALPFGQTSPTLCSISLATAVCCGLASCNVDFITFKPPANLQFSILFPQLCRQSPPTSNPPANLPFSPSRQPLIPPANLQSLHQPPINLPLTIPRSYTAAAT